MLYINLESILDAVEDYKFHHHPEMDCQVFMMGEPEPYLRVEIYDDEVGAIVDVVISKMYQQKRLNPIAYLLEQLSDVTKELAELNNG